MKKKLLLTFIVSTQIVNAGNISINPTLKDKAIQANISEECTDFADAVDKIIVELPQESAAFKTSIEAFTTQWHNFDKAQLPQINTSCKTMAEHIRKRIATKP